MGHSQYDPATQNRPAWNAGKMVGNAPQVSPFNGSGLDPESSHSFKAISIAPLPCPAA